MDFNSSAFESLNATTLRQTTKRRQYAEKNQAEKNLLDTLFRPLLKPCPCDSALRFGRRFPRATGMDYASFPSIESGQALIENDSFRNDIFSLAV